MSASGDSDGLTTSPPLARMLEGLPVTGRRLDLAGVSTSLLEGGEGPPIVLLRGQGGFAAHWMQVVPWGGIGSSPPTFPASGNQWYGWGGWTLAAWLSNLIAQTCAEPPTLVGFSLGGSLAAASQSITGIESAESSWSTRAASAALDQHPARPSRSSSTACTGAPYDRVIRYVVDPERIRNEWG